MPSQFHAFQPTKSRIFVAYTILLYCFAISCVWFTFSGFVLLFLITIPCFLSRREHIISLQYAQKTEWMLELTNNEIARATLLPTSVMLRYLCILHFELAQSKERKTLALFPDSLNARDFQLLRRCVRMGYL